MSDLTKEDNGLSDDENAFLEWVEKQTSPDHGPSVFIWQAACAYKQKHIEELKAALRPFVITHSHGEYSPKQQCDCMGCVGRRALEGGGDEV